MGGSKKMAVLDAGFAPLGPQDVEPITRSSAGKQLLRLEAAAIENDELRRKYAKEPQR